MLVWRGEMSPVDFDGLRDFCFVRKGRRFSYSNRSFEPATLILVHTPSFDLREEVFVGR